MAFFPQYEEKHQHQSFSMTKPRFWHHRVAACSSAVWQTLMKDSVQECGISYHRRLGPALCKIGSCGKWPFCPLAFMLGIGFQNIFEIWPPLGLQQQVCPSPLLGLSGGFVAAQSCSQDGWWNAGTCSSAAAAGKPWSVMSVWRAAGLRAVSGLLCEQLRGGREPGVARLCSVSPGSAAGPGRAQPLPGPQLTTAATTAAPSAEGLPQ